MSIDIYTIFNKWIESGEFLEMQQKLKDISLDNLSEFFENKMSEVDSQIEENNNEVAFNQVMLIIPFVNLCLNIQPRLTTRLKNWTNRLKTTLSALGNNLQAESFSISISVGLPISVSVGLSFKV